MASDRSITEPGNTSGLGWFRRGNARYVLAAVLALVALEATAAVLIFARERATRRAEQDRLALNPTPDVWWRGNLTEAIRRPPTVEAKDAAIRPDETVIGVVVAGKARAYRLGAFHEPRGHLINDLVGGVPVSVAYCNLTDCVRVYTQPRRSAPLDIEVMGLLNGEMVVKIDGALYFQKSGRLVEPGEAAPEIPYRLLTPTRSTWEDWSRLHPETDVYIGDRREMPRGPATSGHQ